MPRDLRLRRQRLDDDGSLFGWTFGCHVAGTARYGDSSAYFESRLDLCEMRRPGCLRAMFDYVRSQEASGDAIPDSVKRARVYIFVDQFPKRHPVSASDKQSPGSDEGPHHTIPGTAHSDSDSDVHGHLGFVLDYCRTDELTVQISAEDFAVPV